MYRHERQEGSVFALRWVWKAYYEALSILLQDRILHPLFNKRSEMRTELFKAQAAYEATLMRDLTFPKANQVNAEIETWVDRVIANWRILLEPPWQNDDLGPGGKAAVGKGILEVR